LNRFKERERNKRGQIKGDVREARQEMVSKGCSASQERKKVQRERERREVNCGGCLSEGGGGGVK
jgi:hypothetical protein